MIPAPGFDSRLWDFFPRSSHTSGLKTDTPVATLTGVIGSVLGLVEPVSVYYDWMRQRVRSAASISVWQSVQLSRSVLEIH